MIIRPLNCFPSIIAIKTLYNENKFLENFKLTGNDGFDNLMLGVINELTICKESSLENALYFYNKSLSCGCQMSAFRMLQYYLEPCNLNNFNCKPDYDKAIEVIRNCYSQYGFINSINLDGNIEMPLLHAFCVYLDNDINLKIYLFKKLDNLVEKIKQSDINKDDIKYIMIYLLICDDFSDKIYLNLLSYLFIFIKNNYKLNNFLGDLMSNEFIGFTNYLYLFYRIELYINGKNFSKISTILKNNFILNMKDEIEIHNWLNIIKISFNESIITIQMLYDILHYFIKGGSNKNNFFKLVQNTKFENVFNLIMSNTKNLKNQCFDNNEYLINGNIGSLNIDIIYCLLNFMNNMSNNYNISLYYFYKLINDKKNKYKFKIKISNLDTNNINYNFKLNLNEYIKNKEYLNALDEIEISINKFLKYYIRNMNNKKINHEEFEKNNIPIFAFNFHQIYKLIENISKNNFQIYINNFKITSLIYYLFDSFKKLKNGNIPYENIFSISQIISDYFFDKSQKWNIILSNFKIDNLNNSLISLISLSQTKYKKNLEEFKNELLDISYEYENELINNKKISEYIINLVYYKLSPESVKNLSNLKYFNYKKSFNKKIIKELLIVLKEIKAIYKNEYDFLKYSNLYDIKEILNNHIRKINFELRNNILKNDNINIINFKDFTEFWSLKDLYNFDSNDLYFKNYIKKLKLDKNLLIFNFKIIKLINKSNFQTAYNSKIEFFNGKIISNSQKITVIKIKNISKDYFNFFIKGIKNLKNYHPYFVNFIGLSFKETLDKKGHELYLISNQFNSNIYDKNINFSKLSVNIKIKLIYKVLYYYMLCIFNNINIKINPYYFVYENEFDNIEDFKLFVPFMIEDFTSQNFNKMNLEETYNFNFIFINENSYFKYIYKLVLIVWFLLNDFHLINYKKSKEILQNKFILNFNNKLKLKKILIKEISNIKLNEYTDLIKTHLLNLIENEKSDYNNIAKFFKSIEILSMKLNNYKLNFDKFWYENFEKHYKLQVWEKEYFYPQNIKILSYIDLNEDIKTKKYKIYWNTILILLIAEKNVKKENYFVINHYIKNNISLIYNIQNNQLIYCKIINKDSVDNNGYSIDDFENNLLTVNRSYINNIFKEFYKNQKDNKIENYYNFLSNSFLYFNSLENDNEDHIVLYDIFGNQTYFKINNKILNNNIFFCNFLPNTNFLNSIYYNNNWIYLSKIYKNYILNLKEEINIYDDLVNIFNNINSRKGIIFDNNIIYLGKIKNGNIIKGEKIFKNGNFVKINDNNIKINEIQIENDFKFKGVLKDNKLNGFGNLFYNEKLVYEGIFKENKFQGKGIINYEENIKCIGIFNKGYICFGIILENNKFLKGFFNNWVEDNQKFKIKNFLDNFDLNGTYLNFSQNIIQIEGFFKKKQNTNLNGIFKIIYYNFSNYIGRILNGQRNNFGIMSTFDGMKIIGYWENLFIKGLIIFKNPKIFNINKSSIIDLNNDNYFQKEISKNKISQVKGIFDYSNNGKIYLNNILITIYSNDNIYIGNYSNNKFNGIGKYNGKNFNYEGLFLKNEIHGVGSIYFRHYLYKGYFKNSFKNGFGILFLNLKNNIIIGNFNKELVTNGVLFNLDNDNYNFLKIDNFIFEKLKIKYNDKKLNFNGYCQLFLSSFKKSKYLNKKIDVNFMDNKIQINDVNIISLIQNYKNSDFIFIGKVENNSIYIGKIYSNGYLYAQGEFSNYFNNLIGEKYDIKNNIIERGFFLNFKLHGFGEKEFENFKIQSNFYNGKIKQFYIKIYKKIKLIKYVNLNNNNKKHGYSLKISRMEKLLIVYENDLKVTFLKPFKIDN